MSDFELIQECAYVGLTERAKGCHGPQKLLGYLGILCFEKRCLKQNTVARSTLKDFGRPKLYG